MSEAPEDEPLDPKVEAIRRKMVRLLMVSGGIMMVGLMTVLIAIVYKLNEAPTGRVASGGATGSISLPVGARIVSTALDGERILFVLETANGERQLRIFNGAGSEISRLDIKQD